MIFDYLALLTGNIGSSRCKTNVIFRQAPNVTDLPGMINAIFYGIMLPYF